MQNIPPGGMGIDLNALRQVMELNLIKQIMRATGKDVPQDDIDRVGRVLEVFGRHGVGAVEALAIMTEITEVLKNESPGT